MNTTSIVEEDPLEISAEEMASIDDGFIAVEDIENLNRLRKTVDEKLKTVDKIELGVEDMMKHLKTSAEFQEKTFGVLLSFNLVLVPLLLAILFGYLTSEQTLSSDAQIARHVFITVLIIVSIFAGFPLYFYCLDELERACPHLINRTHTHVEIVREDLGNTDYSNTLYFD